jgi:DNA-binding response OmpR family regulator
MQKICIIEDDIAIVQMYRMKFLSLGYEVVVAGNGKIGLEIIENETPDIVLLDLMMPIMRGDEVIEALQKTDWGKRTKVVVLTNMGESEVPKSVKAPNVIDYIVKADMTPRQVADKIHSILSKK